MALEDFSFMVEIKISNGLFYDKVWTIKQTNTLLDRQTGKQTYVYKSEGERPIIRDYNYQEVDVLKIYIKIEL